MKTLITTANGMFGNATLRALVARGASVRALVRDAAKFGEVDSGVEVRVGDLDDANSVATAVEGVDRVFLVTPMDARIAERETRVIHAAQAAGVRQIVKIYGAVEHGGDPLDTMHRESIAALQASGLEWSLISPNSVMETSLLPMADAVKERGEIYGISGKGKIGLVALADVAEAAAVVLTGEGHHAQNYEITGAKAVDLFEVARTLSEVLGREVRYVDMPEAAFAEMLVEEAGMPPEVVELEVLCHLRLWREGNAEKVSDAFTRLTGKAPTSLAMFFEQHAARFR